MTTREKSKNGHVQAAQGGPQQKPKPPFPRQHQRKPGLEHKMSPWPRYAAPRYRAAGKLEGKVSLITGGDSGTATKSAINASTETLAMELVDKGIRANAVAPGPVWNNGRLMIARQLPK